MHVLCAVNMPEVELGPVSRETHRLLHFHDNVPGVLAAINTCVGDAECNVTAQHLKTNEHHGYVVLDVERKVSSLSVLISSALLVGVTSSTICSRVGGVVVSSS